MKKLVSSIVVLILVIFSGLMSMKYLNNSSQKTTAVIDNTIGYTRNGMWQDAAKSIDEIEAKWAKTEKTWAMLVDHIEIDNIEMAMIKSKYYIETKDKSMSLAELYNLKFMVEHICDKEMINFKNVL